MLEFDFYEATAGYSLHVDAAFNCCRDEHAPQTAVRVIRESQPLAGFGYRLACLFNVEQLFARLLAIAEFLHQRARPRVNGNCETLPGILAISDDLSGVQIHVLALH